MSERLYRMRAPSGEEAEVPERDVDYYRKKGGVVLGPVTPEQTTGRFLSNATRSVQPSTWVQGAKQVITDPIGVASAMASLPAQYARDAYHDVQQGNYLRAGRKGLEAALPILGGVAGGALGIPGGPAGIAAGMMAGYAGGSGVAAGMDEGMGEIEQGDIAGGAGTLVDATVQGVLGGRMARPGSARSAAQTADALERRSGNLSARVFGPTVGPNRYGWGNEARKLGPEMLRRTTSLTRDGIAQEVESMRQRFNASLDGAYDVQSGGTRMKTAPVRQNLIAEIKSLSMQDKQGQWMPLQGNAERVAALRSALGELDQLPATLDSSQVRQLRQSWDRLAQQVWEPKTNAGWDKVREGGKGYATARTNLNETAMKVYPQLQQPAKDAAFSIGASDLMRALEESESARSKVGRSAITAAGGAAVGAAHGGSIEAALGAVVAPIIESFATEKVLPGVKIAAARKMAQLAQEIRAKGQTPAAMRMVSELRAMAPSSVAAPSVREAGAVMPMAADASAPGEPDQANTTAPAPGQGQPMSQLMPNRFGHTETPFDETLGGQLALAGLDQPWRGIRARGGTIGRPGMNDKEAPRGTEFLARARSIFDLANETPLGWFADFNDPMSSMDVAGAPVTATARATERATGRAAARAAARDLGIGKRATAAVLNIAADAEPSSVRRQIMRSAKFLNATLGDSKIRRYAQFMTPAELESQMTSHARENMKQISRARAQMPGVDELASAVVGGRDKRGWYENSRQALQHVFGDDADLFAGVLAATSPQNSVESNLTNALNIYRNWNAAGRPAGRDAIVGIMGKSVSGSKGEKSVLDAWINNTVNVLEGGNVISGPKVDSFWTNLRSRARRSSMGDVHPDDAVTLDAWMANLFGIDNAAFAGRTTKHGTPAQLAKFAKGDPGYSPKYLAGSSLVRETAQKLGLKPSEVQETAWSFGKALYEKAEALGISAREVVERGLLTPSDISGTVDFALLLKDPQYAGLLGSEHAQRLSTLVHNELPRIADATEAQRKWMLKAADRLDEVRGRRALNSRYRNAENAPGRVIASLPIEAATPPTNRSRVGPTGFSPGQTEKQQDNLSSALLGAGEDLADRGVIEEAVFPGSTGSVRRGFGDYMGQHNSLRTTPVEVRLRANETIPAADERGLRFASGAKSMFVGQDAAVVTAVHFDTKLPHDAVRVTTPNKIDRAGLDAIRRALPEGEWAVQHRSDSVDVLKLDGSITPAEAAQLADVVRQQVPMKATTTNRGENLDEMMPWKSGRNVVSSETAYRELPWGEVGSRDVTRWLMADYSAQSAATKRRLDGPLVRQFAGDLFEAYSKDPASRPDHLNALRIVATKGISGLLEALKDQRELLPMLAAIGLIPAMTRAAGPPTNRQERAQ